MTEVYLKTKLQIYAERRYDLQLLCARKNGSPSTRVETYSGHAFGLMRHVRGTSYRLIPVRPSYRLADVATIGTELTIDLQSQNQSSKV